MLAPVRMIQCLDVGVGGAEIAVTSSLPFFARALSDWMSSHMLILMPSSFTCRWPAVEHECVVGIGAVPDADDYFH